MAGAPATVARVTCMKVSLPMPGEWRSSTSAASGPCSASSARSGGGVERRLARQARSAI